MEITPKKKQITIKVKQHTITVGAKKPGNGGKGVEHPIEPVNLKKSLFSRCVEVIRDDITFKKREKDALFNDPEPSWEEYLRFRELAKK